MKAAQGGHLFLNLYLMFLKKKLICTQGTQEQNTIVKNVVDITDIFLKTDQNQLENAIATMACV
jgi:hypothetical protein